MIFRRDSMVLPARCGVPDNSETPKAGGALGVSGGVVRFGLAPFLSIQTQSPRRSQAPRTRGQKQLEGLPQSLTQSSERVGAGCQVSGVCPSRGRVCRNSCLHPQKDFLSSFTLLAKGCAIKRPFMVRTLCPMCPAIVACCSVSILPNRDTCKGVATFCSGKRLRVFRAWQKHHSPTLCTLSAYFGSSQFQATFPIVISVGVIAQ